MKYGIANKFGQPSQNEIDQIIKYAYNNKIYYYDTAQSYGNSEILLGNALELLPNITKVKIISKLNPIFHKGKISDIINSVKLSIKKLKVDFLYGFLIHHFCNSDIMYYSNLFKALKDEGLIKKGGVSVYTIDEAKVVLNNSIFEIIQIPFNILDRRWVDEKIIKIANEKDVQIFFRSIFLQGLIFLNKDDLIKKSMDWALPYIDEFNGLVSKCHSSPMELSFKLLSNMAGDNIVIMGVDNLEQLKKNVICINSIKQENSKSMDWWSLIPSFPEKLLNPTLW